MNIHKSFSQRCCLVHFQSCLLTGGSVFENVCSALLKTNCLCSNVSCHHLQDFTTWFYPQDCFAPINRPIHLPNLYWSAAGNELHTCRPWVRTAQSPQIWPPVFNCTLSSAYMMYINWGKGEIKYIDIKIKYIEKITHEIIYFVLLSSGNLLLSILWYYVIFKRVVISEYLY